MTLDSRHGLCCFILEFPRPRKAHIQYRLPGSLVSCSLRLGQRAFRFLLPAEYVLHIHDGFLHHFGFEVRVDVGRGLVIRVSQYLHGNQRLYSRFKQQRRIIVPEIMRRERWFQLLDNVVLALGCFGHLALLYAIGSFYQTEPDTFEAALRPRLAFLGMEYILLRESANLGQHSAQLLRNRNVSVSSSGFQCAVMCRGANVINVALDMYQIFIKIEVTPLQAQRLAAPQAEIVKHCQKQAMLMVLDGMQHVLGFLIGQRPTLGFFLCLGADDGYAWVALNDALGVCAGEQRFERTYPPA